MSDTLTDTGAFKAIATPLEQLPEEDTPSEVDTLPFVPSLPSEPSLSSKPSVPSEPSLSTTTTMLATAEDAPIAVVLQAISSVEEVAVAGEDTDQVSVVQKKAPTEAVTAEDEDTEDTKGTQPEKRREGVSDGNVLLEGRAQAVPNEDAPTDGTLPAILDEDVPTDGTLPAKLDEDGTALSEEQETVEISAASTPEATDVLGVTGVPVATGVDGGLPVRARKQSKLFLAVAICLFLLSISGTMLSAFFAFEYGISAYTTYTTLRDQANEGVTHLLNVKTIFTGLKAHPSGFLDINKLHAAQKEFNAAQVNFQHVQYTMSHAAIIGTVVAYLPQYRPEVAAASAVSKIGIDVTAIGQKLVSTAITLAPTFRGSLLNSGSTPLVTQPMLDLLHSTIDAVIPNLNDIQVQSRSVSLSTLPINAHERDQLAQLLQALPQAETDLLQARDLLGAAGWMLGVGTSRTFLVQTMDRAELRPTGGFTGQYGELSIKGGRVAPFSLRDISLVEYVDNSPTQGLLALPQYRSWWPFANWGLRDSNLSADFPTSAQIAISKYKSETGHAVDGVIIFTPFLIEHILEVIGPIQVPGYNDTITAQNVEERLHYYQQDNAGLAKQVVYQPGDTTTSSRKRFTSLLAHLLMDKVRHAPPDELITIGRQMLYDLKTKDLQVYVTNPQIESLLVQYGDAAQIDRSTTHDGEYVVQANVSASKASQFVHTILQDTVSLNAEGGATHVLHMRLVYNQIGPVYGYDTYRDYVRVYVPPSSTFLWGDGFDTGNPLCGAYLPACPQTDVYPKDELLCPNGEFQPGAAAPTIADPNGGSWHPLDTVGPPTNLNSDESGRAMFGGWVVIPKNCTMNVMLSWYVPPTGSHGSPYALLVQRQAGTFPELDLTILPTPGNCSMLKTAGQHFDGIMGEDTMFTVPRLAPSENARATCYPQPGV